MPTWEQKVLFSLFEMLGQWRNTRPGVVLCQTSIKAQRYRCLAFRDEKAVILTIDGSGCLSEGQRG